MKTLTVYPQHDGNPVEALIDDELYEAAKALGRWRLDPVTGYARVYTQLEGQERPAYTYLHRWVMQLPRGKKVVVEMLNGNKLDCQRENLEIARPYNKADKASNPKRTSQFRGVDLLKPRGVWRARGVIGKTTTLIGYFDTESEAAAAAAIWRSAHEPEQPNMELLAEMPRSIHQKRQAQQTERDAEMLARRDAGETLKSIAKDFGMHYTGVRKAIARLRAQKEAEQAAANLEAAFDHITNEFAARDEVAA